MKRKSLERVKSDLWERLRPEIDSATLAGDIKKFLDQHVGKSVRHVNLANNIARYLTQKYSVSDRTTGELRPIIEHHSDDLDAFLEGIRSKQFQCVLNNLDKLPHINEKPRRVRPQTQAETKQRRRRSKRNYDRRRSSYREGLIIKQFGSDPIFDLVDLKYVSPESPCLDILFKGRGVRRAGTWDSLENLFGEDRHTFPKSLPSRRQGRIRLHYADAFIECLIHLLAGRAGRKQWLPEGDRGKLVLGRMIVRAHRFSPKLATKLIEKLRPYL